MLPGGQIPIIVLNVDTKREEGRKAQLSNIAAGKAVSSIVRTTLGPKAMLKMMLDPIGGICMTNDGNAILREIDVVHPAAKSMIELSRAQDEEVGDGTTSVIILAGEMLNISTQFFKKEIHPSIVVQGYYKALEDAIKIAESILELFLTIDKQQDHHLFLLFFQKKLLPFPLTSFQLIHFHYDLYLLVHSYLQTFY